MTIFQILGSLYFAVSLIAGLTLTLIASTLLESFYGTPFVQRHFYQSAWFNIFLGLLAVNILVSAMNRFPYKKRHTGFVMTHVGILMLLAGSLVSSWMGIDGQMMLFEGEKKNSIAQTSYELVVHEMSGKITPVTLATGNRTVKRRLDSSAGPMELTIHRVWDNAVIKTDIEDSPSSIVNHATQLTLSSEKTGVKEDLWLVENNPLDPNSNHFSMGPAVFEIREKPEATQSTSKTEGPAEYAKVRIYKKDSDLDFTVNLDQAPAGNIPLGSSEYTVSNLKYYPDARVGDNNHLNNASDQPKNPAVEFDVTGPDGSAQHYIKFMLFPEFESMHAKNAKKNYDFSVEMTAPSAHSHTDSGGPSLSILYGSDGSWSYASKSSAGVSEGVIKPGETYQTGWMDFSFRVDNLFDHATVIKHVEQAPAGAKGQISADVSVTQNGQTLFRDWVLEDFSQTVQTGSTNLVLALQSKNYKVPFALELKDFRKVDYPGTNQASSFESDVTLTDPEVNLTLNKTISMNKPLDYKGYRIFQSSFIQDASSGEASVFTVAKNPGIYLIYGGAIVMFVGSFLVFFVAPFSSMLREGKK